MASSLGVDEVAAEACRCRRRVVHTSEGLKQTRGNAKTNRGKEKISENLGPGGSTAAGFSARIFLRFWAPKLPRIHGEMAKLRLGNANKGGGGPKATDPWTKTTKNATNRQIGSNQGKAIFGGNFRISQKRRKIWWILVETQNKSVST